MDYQYSLTKVFTVILKPRNESIRLGMANEKLLELSGYTVEDKRNKIQKDMHDIQDEE